jgi:hypothetical protein
MSKRPAGILTAEPEKEKQIEESQQKAQFAQRQD